MNHNPLFIFSSTTTTLSVSIKTAATPKLCHSLQIRLLFPPKKMAGEQKRAPVKLAILSHSKPAVVSQSTISL